MGSYYGIGTMKSFFNREGGYLYLIDNESEKDGAPGGNRTHDPLLRRQLLYPLSYQGFPCRKL